MSTQAIALRRASFAIMLILPLIMLASVLGTLAQGLGLTDFGIFVLEQERPPPVTNRAAIWWLVMIGPLLLWLAALWKLFRAFRGFSKGQFLESEAISRLHQFAYLAALAVLLSIALSGVAHWTTQATLDLASCILLSISGEQSLLLFLAAIIFVFSGILMQAEAYKKEIEEYV